MSWRYSCFYYDYYANIKSKIDEALADPKIYTNSNPDQFENLSKKRAEAETAITKAEGLWLAAEEKLETSRTNL